MKSTKIAMVAAGAIASTLILSSAVLAQSVNGEVKKIDEAASKITLKHGPIKALDMMDDTMTMVFTVQDAAMLKQVKVGDKVKFDADRVNGKITVTKMEKAN